VRILVVDDNPVNQQVAVGLLRRFGVPAEVADDGLAALDALRQRPFDLVLMDLQMPRLDGMEATRQIRAGGGGVLNPRVPVVALTANAFPEYRTQCQAAGFDDFLTKPVSARLLGDAIEKLLPGVRLIGRGAAGSAPPAAHGARTAAATAVGLRADAPVLDRAGLLERSLEDPELAREVLEAFLREVSGLYASLARHLRAREAQQGYTAAHALRGAAANAGATLVRDLCSDIEARARGGELDAAIDRLGALATQIERFRTHAPAELNADGLRAMGVA
jgi:CheY-like chemotaxis protein